MYVITDPKGLIRDISALGFAYLNLTKDCLSSTERYIDEFGISPTAPEFKDGAIVRIPKSPHQHRQDSFDTISERTSSDGEEFFVKLETILLPFQGDEELEEGAASLVKNGRRNVGLVFHF